MAIRLSIGASRWNLIAQLMAESLLLAILGGIAGLFVAQWTLRLIMALQPAQISQAMPFSLSPTVLVFTAAVTIGTGLLFGLFPALHSTRPDLLSVLKGQTGQPSGARGAARFRLVLATAQIALSMALLAAAGFFVKSLFNVTRVDLGVKIDNVITFGLSPELNGYTPERSRIFFERLEEKLAATPGATGVTVSLVPLVGGSNWGTSVAVQGFQSGPDTDDSSRFNEIGPGYFRTLGVPLMSGREFTDADVLKSQKVAIVNQEFLKKFGLGSDAVGKMMGTQGLGSKLDVRIVGVVQNLKYSSVKDAIPPVFYMPYRQDERLGAASVYVRTAGDPAQFASTVTSVVKSLDPNLPLEDLKTMPQQVKDNTFLDRLMSTLSALFAMLATLLAGVGLYGVLAYTVSQRIREFGLRMALGAAPSRVRTMVLSQVGWMLVVGGVIGLIGAYALGRGAEAILYGIKGSDPIVLLTSTIVLAAVALSAGLIPAYRASRVDPMTALRYE
jgi:predicted permease